MFRFISIVVLLAAGQMLRAAELAAPSRAVVLVVPFVMLSDEGRHAWIGHAIAQNLQAELGHDRSVRVVGNITITPTTQPIAGPANVDEDAAMRLAEKAGADVLILGSYQVVSTEVRVTGKVMDVRTRRSMGVLKGTASQRQLLALEDALAAQARAALGLEAEEAVAQVDRTSDTRYDDQRATAASVSAEPVGPVAAGYEPAQAPYAYSEPLPPAYTYGPAYRYVPSYVTGRYYYDWDYPYTSAYTYGYPLYSPYSYCPPSYGLGFYYGYRQYSYRRNHDWDDSRGQRSQGHGPKGLDGPRRDGPTTAHPPKRGGEVARVGTEPRGLGPRNGPVATEPRRTQVSRNDVRPRPTDVKREAVDTKRTVDVKRPRENVKREVVDTKRTVDVKREAVKPSRPVEVRRESPRVESPPPARARVETPPPRARVETPPPRARVETPPPRARVETPPQRARVESPPARVESRREAPVVRAERPSSPPPASRGGGSSSSSNGGSSGGRAGRR
jgi:TolB-like protein